MKNQTTKNHNNNIGSIRIPYTSVKLNIDRSANNTPNHELVANNMKCEHVAYIWALAI